MPLFHVTYESYEPRERPCHLNSPSPFLCKGRTPVEWHHTPSPGPTATLLSFLNLQSSHTPDIINSSLVLSHMFCTWAFLTPESLEALCVTLLLQEQPLHLSYWNLATNQFSLWLHDLTCTYALKTLCTT